MKGWKRSTALHVGAFVLYALLTGLMTWPVCARLTTHLIGNGDDMWVHFWNGWWVRRILRQGGDLYYTPLLFHPTGVSLRFHNFAWFSIVPWLVMEPILGGIAAYNLAFLFHIPLCGLSMFVLARHLTGSTVAAFLSGIIYAFLPYRMLHANHPNVISTEGFPLLMLVLLRLVEGKRPLRQGVWAGLLIALIGYTRWQFLVLAGLMTGGYLLYSLLCEREKWGLTTTTGLILMVIVAAVLMSPALYPLIRAEMTSGLPEEVDTANFENGKQDILTYVIPQHQHPLRPLYDRVFPSFANADLRTRYSAFLGHVVVVLAAVGVVKQWKRARTKFWLGLAATCLVLALGPHLWFNQVQTGIPMPYTLIGWLQPIKLFGPPRRFNALLGVPFTVLAGYGLVAVREALTKKRWGTRIARPIVFASLLSAILLLDYVSIPTNTIPAHVPDFYSSLREEQGDFAVLGLPGPRKYAEYYMFYQTGHGRPILSGHVSNLPPEALTFMSSVPLLSDVYSTGDIDTSLPDVSRQLSLLAQAGFRYMVMHKHFVPPDQLDQWRTYLVASPRYEDDEVVTFSTSPTAGRDFSLRHEMAPGLGLIQVHLSSETVRPESSLQLRIVWGTIAPLEEDFQLEIALVNEQGDVDQAERFEISSEWPMEEWPANAIVHDSYVFIVDPWVHSGEQTVVATLVSADDGRAQGREVQIGKVVMEIPERVFEVPSLERAVGARFGDVLRLLGYDLKQETDVIGITLHWEALRRMGRSYKFFLHLYDVESGELVAQKDVIPYDWGYPTVWWESHEIVSDRLRLPLTEVPPGRYQLAVGVYDSQTLERLSVSGERPTASSEALILQELAIP
jgi:hypothetical protein